MTKANLPNTMLLLAFLLLANVCIGQVENGCIFIDFESIPNTTLASGTPISDQFESTFGLSFNLENGSVPVLAQVGSPIEAFGSQWGDDIPAPGVDIGQFFITDDGVLQGLSSSPLVLEFSIPIDTFAGCILDVDFGEEFTIEALDASGNVLLSETIVDGDEGTGDGELTCWGFNLPGCVASITTIRFSGIRTEPGGFGLGMDNFRFCYTGANIEIDTEDFSCNNFGQISVFSTTTEVYEFSLNNIQFSTENVFKNLTPGFYEVFIRDSDGCTSSVTVEVEEDLPIISSAEVQHTNCDEDNGAIEIIVTPNNGAQISLDNQFLSGNSMFENLAAGTYQINIEDETGCMLDTVLVINPSLGPPEITDVIVRDDFCQNGEGSIELASSGGNGVVEFNINGGTLQTNGLFESLAEGEYTIMAIDEDGCSNEVVVNVDLGQEITLARNYIVAPDCLDPNGEFAVTASGGNGDLIYSIDSLLTQISPVFENIASGTYNIVVKDSEGCEEQITIEIPCSSCDIYFPNVITPDIPGPNHRFQIFTTQDYNITVKLYNIYDRWGNLVYTAEDFPIHDSDDIWWTGYFDNVKVVLGVYTYLVILEDSCGDQTLHARDVMVIW
jgi:hypothetical protein